jgi:hypothetical protein
MKARWIIQNKNYADDDRQAIIDACDKRGIPCIEINVIPFSPELPDFPIDDEYENIYYGSTTMMDRVYADHNRPKGLFYNHETFSIENYINKWGEHMLSEEAEFMTVQEFLDSPLTPHEMKWFMRPDGDGKQFDGVVGLETELKDMLRKATAEVGGPITLDLKILIAPPYNIHREWRNYVVNGKVITSSRYRKNFRLSKSGTDIPEEMIKFVEDRCKEYQPHDIFAMDIAETRHDDGTMHYYIIECGCMNSVGFYHCDIDKYVEKLTEWVERNKIYK